MELADGRCDMAITGGVDTLNDIFMYMCFSKTPALGATGNARPFDHQGDGTILGEGVGILILKRLDDAVRDGDRIYAEIRGLGSSSDGKGNAIYAPSSSGQAKALRRAYQRADATPDTVQLVEAHGTGTIVGDAAESEALTAVYRESGGEGTWRPPGSGKSQSGHTKAAAGAAMMGAAESAEASSIASRISSAVSVCVTWIPTGSGRAVGAETSRALAPRSRAASAIAYPIFPEDLLEMKRTGSTGSCVPPALTTIVRSARSPVRPSTMRT